jgi:hypothetical protein
MTTTEACPAASVTPPAAKSTRFMMALNEGPNSLGLEAFHGQAAVFRRVSERSKGQTVVTFETHSLRAAMVS